MNSKEQTMKKLDIAVVGSGIGGSLFCALNKNKNIILFEKDSNLGGCASTFKRFGHYFNTGATTFVGYEENHILKNIFDKIGFKPDILESQIAFRTIQNGEIIDRKKDFDTFLKDLNKVHFHENNEIFWKKIKEIDEKFWQLKSIYFSKYSLKSYLKSANFVFELLRVFGLDLFKSANSFINKYLPNISKEYRNFIDAQLLITIQTTSKNATLLSMALGLAYPFHKVFYANKGMGNIFDELLKDIEVHKKEEVLEVIKKQNGFEIITNKDRYFSRNVVLNSTIFDSSKLFKDEKIKNYYKSFSFSNQSAFVVYLVIKTKKEFQSHYQIILDKNITNAISNSFFVSFSRNDDEKLAKNGLSVTISTHTQASFWTDLKMISLSEYIKQKELTMNHILNELKSKLDIIDEEIIIKFCATSNSFNSFINRTNCGGKALSFSSIFEAASIKTPFKGLYNIGDTVFSGQGWPGVAVGVDVLNKEINGKC